jgi:hypothetical protein
MRSNKKSRFQRWRTKLKILTAFYQIVTQMEGVLGIRFPPIFENFSRSVSRIANLSFLHVARVDCMMKINFYTTLATMTIAPFVGGLLIALVGLTFYKRTSNPEKKRDILKDTNAILLTLSYLVFASVSTAIFETFNCTTFGDDETRYLVSDQSVSCDTNEHKLWQIYASVMMFFYPFGTPLLYSWLLWKDREVLKDDEERDKNESTNKSAFLWDQYSTSFWWFDIFDCARRLLQTSFLIFVFKGMASQIVFAMLLSAVSSGFFIHWSPSFGTPTTP